MARTHLSHFPVKMFLVMLLFKDILGTYEVS